MQVVTVEEIKWLRVDYEIRCVQLVALCMLGARKSGDQTDNTPFLLLKKAEELTARDGLHYCKKRVQRAAVYQSIANHYKKRKKYQAALQAAEKAVRINETLAVRDRLPISYFLKACLHGLLNDPSNSGLMYTECLNLAEAQQPSHPRSPSAASEDQQASETFNVLKAAALHNMAIEWANLHMPEQSRDALASAMEVGVKCLPQTHPVVLRILDTYKVMRQNFLFKGSEVAPIVNRPSPPPSFTNTDDATVRKPLSPKSPKSTGATLSDKRSPRVEQFQPNRSNVQKPRQNISPQRPASRPAPETAAIGRRESPRKRATKRPMTTPEMPTGRTGRSMSPEAAWIPHMPSMPEEGYAHALGSKCNPHKAHVLAEVRMFVARKKAASRIQSLWRFALGKHRAQQEQLQASVHIQSVVRMRHERTRFNHTLEVAKQIQALWRGSLVRWRRANQYRSSIQIQSVWRGKHSRKEFADKKAKTILIQAAMRGFLTRTSLASQQASAIVIQSHVRRRINENAMKKTTSAAATINRLLRGMHARRRVQCQKAAANRDHEMLVAREVQSVMEELMSMIEVLSEILTDVGATEFPSDRIVDPDGGKSIDLEASFADEGTPVSDVCASAFDECWYAAADESVPVPSPDEAQNEIASEISCGIQCEGALDADESPQYGHPALCGSSDQNLTSDQSNGGYRLTRSDTNQALFDVILSSIVSRNVEAVISSTIEHYSAAQVHQKPFHTTETEQTRERSVCAAVEEPVEAELSVPAVVDLSILPEYDLVHPLVESDEATHPSADANRYRSIPAPFVEIGWDPSSQDRSQVVRNVVALYVYSTLQYALLEALHTVEETDLEANASDTQE